MHGDWFILPPPIIWFSLDLILSTLIDSVVLMTLLMSPIFDFHQVISTLAAPITTPTRLLVKTSLTVVYHDLLYGTQWNLSLYGWHLKGNEKGIPGVVEASPPPVSFAIVQSHAQIPFLFPFECLPCS